MMAGSIGDAAGSDAGTPCLCPARSTRCNLSVWPFCVEMAQARTPMRCRGANPSYFSVAPLWLRHPTTIYISTAAYEYTFAGLRIITYVGPTPRTGWCFG